MQPCVGSVYFCLIIFGRGPQRNCLIIFGRGRSHFGQSHSGPKQFLKTVALPSAQLRSSMFRLFLLALFLSKVDSEGDCSVKAKSLIQRKEIPVVDDDANILKFVSGCKFLFLDVGSNRGTHIRKLFEPQLYESAPYLQIFDATFGNASFRSQPSSVTGLCGIGIEPNPRWAQRFTQIEKAYQTMGWKVKWLRKAVSNRTTNISFWGDNAAETNDEGFSSSHRVDETHAWVPVQVQTLVFAELLEKIHSIIPESRKLIKMDIEGSEYEVLQQMLEKQLLCKTRIDTLTIEWHLDKLINKYQVKFDPETIQKYRDIEQRLGEGDSCSEGEPTKVIALDDESFIADGRPLPGGWERWTNVISSREWKKEYMYTYIYIYMYIHLYIYIYASWLMIPS